MKVISSTAMKMWGFWMYLLQLLTCCISVTEGFWDIEFQFFGYLWVSLLSISWPHILVSGFFFWIFEWLSFEWLLFEIIPSWTSGGQTQLGIGSSIYLLLTYVQSRSTRCWIACFYVMVMLVLKIYKFSAGYITPSVTARSLFEENII